MWDEVEHSHSGRGTPPKKPDKGGMGPLAVICIVLIVCAFGYMEKQKIDDYIAANAQPASDQASYNEVDNENNEAVSLESENSDIAQDPSANAVSQSSAIAEDTPEEQSSEISEESAEAQPSDLSEGTPETQPTDIKEEAPEVQASGSVEAPDTPPAPPPADTVPQPPSVKNPLNVLTDDRLPSIEDVARSQTGEMHEVSYTWSDPALNSSAGFSYRFDVGIYNYYSALPRRTLSDFSTLIKDEYNLKLLEVLNNGIDEMGSGSVYSSAYQKVLTTISFVQSLDYITDQDSAGAEDWAKYPIETLYDQAGDCEDTSILLAGLLYQRGYKCCLIVYQNHCAVGIASDNIPGTCFNVNGTKYYNTETTGSGWSIGQIPDEFASQPAKIIEIQ